MNSNTQDESSSAQFDDEVDLLELWHALMRGKWIIVVVTLMCSVGSVFYALSLPNMYKSTAILAPAASAGGGGLSVLGGQLGGLASLAGINLGSRGSNKTAEAIEVLKSWAFIEEFIQEQGISPEVFAVKEWSLGLDKLIYDAEIYDSMNEKWVREPREGKLADPSSWELYKVFDGRYLSVSEDQQTGFISVGIQYYSPYLAKKWVDELVVKINSLVQLQDSKAAERNIAFLKEQVEKTQLASMQGVFYELIEEQTKNLMLATASTEYVFKTVSESRIAEEKSSPKRAIICIAGAVLGGFIGCIIALITGMRKRI